jgi:hypothetical protein
MSEPITQNEMQHMLDRTIERITNDIRDRLSNLEFRANQTGQDVQHIRNDLAQLINRTPSSNQTEVIPPADNTFRM